MSKLFSVNCETAINGESGFCNCNSCFENEGNCLSHDEYQNDLVCGTSNCPTSLGFDSEVNCCYEDESCEDPTWAYDFHDFGLT